MGRFAVYLYSAGDWTECDAEAKIDQPETPWLYLSIHDSDFAVVRHAPTGPGTGAAFLGVTPRDYLDDPDASAPTDTFLEAHGLVEWARVAETGAAPDPHSIEGLLVADGAEQPDWNDPNLPEDEIFVEGKCRRLIALLGLPDPPGL